MDDASYTTTFGNGRWKLCKGSLVVAKGPKIHTLYELEVSSVSLNPIVSSGVSTISLWHHRMAHIGVNGMKELARLSYLPSLPFSDFPHCSHCIFGKQTETPHKKTLIQRRSKLELVHTDVCEMSELSLGGAKYIVPLRLKSDVLSVFQKFVALVENQTGTTVRSLRSDNGGEYISHAFNAFCEGKGIKRELTAPYNPPQNGVAKRTNRIIQERVRSKLSHVALSHGFWAEAVHTAVHVLNRSPHTKIGSRVPEELWTGKPPSYTHLRVFGCKAYVHIRKDDCTKLEPKSHRCIFLGYGHSGEMRYRLWDPQARKIVRSNDVIFNETCMYRHPVMPSVRRDVIDGDVMQPGQQRPAGQQQIQRPIQPNNAENDLVALSDIPP